MDGGAHIKLPLNGAECSGTMVEIKIKTLDSQTFTLRVDKCVPVPELKRQIASVTGVVMEQQRLICRGRVLKDDQLLSAYHVEDGHTLHLVVRQPIVPLADMSGDTATDGLPSSGPVPSNRVRPGVLIGSFNVLDEIDREFPNLNQIVSAVFNSIGVTRNGSGEGIDLNRPPSEVINNSNIAGGLSSDQTASAAVSLDSIQPPIIPDSLSTLLQYANHLRQEFFSHGGWQSENSQSTGLPVADGLELGAGVTSGESRRLLTPESLARVISSTRELLCGEASECLQQLAGQLESHSSVTDLVERSRIQYRAVRSGVLFQNLGGLLLELGRTIMTVRMGRTPADALVNAGPPVFISSMGPNPIMVQPPSFQPAATVGSVPFGLVQNGSGLVGASAATGYLPRNIDIRIRTGPFLSRRDVSHPQTEGLAGAVSSAPPSRQDASSHETNAGDREQSHVRIPMRTVVSNIPSSAEHGADSSRGPFGIFYPVLARVQHTPIANSNGSTASQGLEHHNHHSDNSLQPDPESTAQQESAAPPTGNGSLLSGGGRYSIRGIEQLLSSIFHGEDYISPPSAPGVINPPSVTTEEGLFLSHLLRQVLPMVSDDIGTGSSFPPTNGTNSEEAEEAEDLNLRGRGGGGTETQPSPKRQRRH